jgi:5-methylcytosine-specific restriction endonuclease McrA
MAGTARESVAMKLDDAVESLIIDEVTRAVVAIGDGDVDSAREALARIDVALLEHIRAGLLQAVGSVTMPGSARSQRVLRRRSVEREKLAVFREDRWTCRFCGRKTIDVRVLRQLSKALPDAFPFHPNWKFGESHLLYWTHSTSLEHLVPLARGGADSRESFVTTCYGCNDARSDFTLEELGWVLLPRTQNGWDGLTGFLPDLAHLNRNPAPRSHCGVQRHRPRKHSQLTR